MYQASRAASPQKTSKKTSATAHKGPVAPSPNSKRKY